MKKLNLLILLLTIILLTNSIMISFLFKFSNDIDSIRTKIYEAVKFYAPTKTLKEENKKIK